MPRVTCKQCDYEFQVDRSEVGRNVFCPSCGQSNVAAPAAGGASSRPTAPSQPAAAPGAFPRSSEPLVNSQMATWAVVCAVLGFCVPGLGILGLILGLVAMSKIDDPVNRLTGRGKAQTGAILGGISIVGGCVIVPLIAMLLPALGAARNSARMMQNSTQIRGIHQGLNIYAQGSRSFFPGLKANGQVMTPDDLIGNGVNAGPNESGAEVTARLAIMLEGDYFTGDYIISPGEDRTLWQYGDQLTPDHYSYALLTLEPNFDGRLKDYARHGEWRDTVNSLAVVLGDRNVTGDTDDDGDEMNAQSIWTSSPGDWRGSVGWNDNHVSQEIMTVMENTQYGKAPAFQDDSLFQGGRGDNWATPIGGGSTVNEGDAELNHETGWDR